MYQIREIQPNTDLDGLRECVVELQDFEKMLIPEMPSGNDILERYITDVFQRCEKYAGRVFVAAVDDCVVGYISIFTQMKSDSIADGDSVFASIGDLVVLERYRRKGLSRLLLARAEDYARSHGSVAVRIGVLSCNVVAADLYRSIGYRSLSEQLEKVL